MSSAVMMPFWYGCADKLLIINTCTVAPLWHGLSLDACVIKRGFLTGEIVDSEGILKVF
jgi:hypothetical protein